MMLSGALSNAVETAISAAVGAPFRIVSVTPVSGGCIHQSYTIASHSQRFFVKCNEAALAAAFSAEADGLAALAAAGARVPAPVCCGAGDAYAFIVLEHLQLDSSGNWADMGRMLAATHRATFARFGWERANFIGATPQENTWHESWLDFWRDERLAPQLALAQANGLDARIAGLGERVINALPRLLEGHAPVPSLLHGDLWSGNVGFTDAGQPVAFDPAVYYGDREADIAMTELFGGFPRSFYAAYREAWPLERGYAARRDLYNLYHILNHANLFGGSYAGQAAAMMERLLQR